VRSLIKFSPKAYRVGVTNCLHLCRRWPAGTTSSQSANVIPFVLP